MNILIAEIPQATPVPRIIHASMITARSTDVADIPSKTEFDMLEEQRNPPVGIPVGLRETCWKMVKACLAGDGIGLAAPQIGIRSRMFVVRFSEESFKVFLNPSFISTDSMVSEKEGCLSVPGVTLDIPRHKSIQAEWFEFEDGEVLVYKSETLTGQLARVFQHEFDHLDAKSIIDRSGFSRSDRRALMKKTRG